MTNKITRRYRDIFIFMKRKHRDSETARFQLFPAFPCPRFPVSLGSRKGGFTLLEILVAVALLGIAITVVLQLFSANLRALSVSGDYVSAAMRADAKMREILEDSDLAEKSWSEVTDDGYRFDASITETLKERTENLQVRLLEITLTTQWLEGSKTKFLTLKTLRTVNKTI
jgi:prepilin-type N-terminal cleavage/methylation domain-containing protein